MTRALVLGGAGFIGQHACKELMRRGVETIAGGRKPREYGTFTSYVVVDRTDEAQLAATLEQVKPDVLLDLACYQPSEVLAVERHFKGVRYVFISTGVYPDLNGKPAEEDDFKPLEGDPPDGLDYLNGKRWCETMIARSSLPYTVVRPPAVMGANDHTKRIAVYISHVEKDEPQHIPVESADRQLGLAWAKDVGYVCALASEPKRDTNRKAYNVAFEGVTIRHLMDAIGRMLGKEPKIVEVPYAELPAGSSPYGPNPARSAGYNLSCSRAELGFEPSALEDALAETMPWYRATKPLG